MRTKILTREWRVFGQTHFLRRSRSIIVMAALLLAAANLVAAPTVNWLSGGPNPSQGIGISGYGSSDGDITLDAEYHTPCGLAMSLNGNYLFVADRDNNEVRVLQFDQNATYHVAFYNQSGDEINNFFTKPVGVALGDLDNALYVLNSGTGKNGTVFKINIDLVNGIIGTLSTNLTKITNAGGIAADMFGNIYVTANNQVFKVAPSGVSNVVATVTAAAASLQGIVMKQSGPTAGLLAVCDTGRNGILLINPNTGVITTNAGFHGAGDFSSANNISSSNSAKFYQPVGVAETGDGSLIVSDNSNNRIKMVLASGIVTNLCGVTKSDWVSPYPGFMDGTVVVPDAIGGVALNLPNGVAIAPDGTVYVTEDCYHIIRHISAGLKPPQTPPSQPTALTATADYGQVVLTWTGNSIATNYNIKRSLTTGGPYTNDIIASTTGTSYTDRNVIDGTTYYYVVSDVSVGGESANSSEASATPLFSPAPVIFLPTTTNYNLVGFSWSLSAGATSYNVKRAQSTNGPFTSIANTITNGYNDTSVLNGVTYYYVVSALNPGGEGANSWPPVSGTPPIPPVPDPQIGYVDFPLGSYPFYTSVFHQIAYAELYNDTLVVIKGTVNTGTHYTYGYTTNASDVPDPTVSSPSVPSDYADGLPDVSSVTPYVVAQEAPYLIVKAIGTQNNGSPSAVVSATFQFKTGNPNINGNNAAQFTISDITFGAHLYYTLDESDPSSTNPAAIDLGTIPVTTNIWTVSFPIQTNTMFKVRAYHGLNFQPSAIVTNWFYTTNFLPNVISFGFNVGEASSVFVASPGQTFYAPVTLTVLPNTVMDSLQFNLTVHSIGSSVPIAPGAYGFQTMLMKPDPINPNYLLPIYPYMFINNATNPPPTNQIVHYEGTNFVNMVTTNLSLNLLGVGWLERQGQTNLFNTLGQNLLSKSLAHDDVFPNPQQPSGTIVGGYSFQVPVTAAPGDSYQIQIARPSATTDGIGDPGSAVYIYAPTNGSLAAGAMNATKNVTMGQIKYTVGNVYPFRWFNAGDFGDTNLINADVMQVFQSAIYGLNFPPAGSDFFDAMDSCGATYVDFGHGYLELNTTNTDPNLLNLLFDGNDTTINQIAFGDGVLDVCDVYVTYRRSQDSSLTWFRRFWTNGVRVAEMAPNVVTSGMVSQAMKASKIINAADNSSSYVSITNQPKVIFTAGDCQTNAGKTIQIPITANIFGNYPLRTLMLNLTVVPIDGSPVLTTPVAFSYNPALGQPWTTDQKGNGNYSAVWLNSGISGLSNNVSIGTLTVTLPATATSLSAYAVHFDHVSASPNGLASFPKLARTGLITFSSRNNSSYGDGIPDSWRLRYFLTLNNYLSQTNADADGDGLNNLQEYMAGTDPTDPTSCFKTIGNDLKAAQQPQDCVISWPSVIGKQYVIQRSPSLSARIWTSVATNSGNGTIMEYHDTSGGGIRYYRVSVQ